MKSQKSSRFGKTSFFSGKGFYIALAISLIAIGGAAWLGLNSALNKLGNNNEAKLGETPSQIIEGNNTNEWDYPDVNVNKPETNVPAVENDKNQQDQQDQQDEQSSQPETPKKPAKQTFAMPLTGEIFNPYSGDQVVKSKTLDEWVMHTGIDIKAKESTPVKAISSGKVTKVYNDPMWGACVIIDHGNSVESHYYNLKSAVNVKVNQQVNLGDVLGAVGNTAEIEQSEESHLHFGIKQNGDWVDPMSIIK